MAVLAAKKATDLKNNYRDGLLYLAIAYDRSARVNTIRQESASYLLAQSDKYLQLAHESDPAYFTANPDM
jgi:predicted alpha-1,6-mannanase (GH76 family)